MSQIKQQAATSQISQEGDNQKLTEVLVGIPAYNEEVAIGSVVLSVKEITERVLVVDDGSADATAEIAEEAGAEVISHKENRGKGAAVRTIFAEAQSKEIGALVLLDGDGQHIADDIPEVVEPVLDGACDVSIGSRYLDGEKTETPLYRRFGQKVLDLLTTGSSGTSLTDTQSGFRAFSPNAVEKMSIRTDGIGVESEMIDSATTKGFDIEEVPIDVKYEEVDGQTYNPLHHGLSVVVFLLQLIRDKHPMVFFGLPGLILLGVGGGLVTNAALLYQSSGAFHQWRILFGGFMVMIGTMALFSGLLLNQVSNMMANLEK